MAAVQAGWQATLGLLGLAVPDSDFCANATYEHRLDDPSTYNWCSVPSSGPDAFLFAALAVLVACCLHFSSLSAVFVLVAGALFEAVVYPINLGRLGNAFTLWLGINPPELFFYAFLPPLLLDSALSIDYFLFNKVMLQVFVFAFLVVLLSALLTTPVLLYGLGLAAHGWRWQHGALFSAMLASTDALAIAAVLRNAGGPESLITLMEGESLLNDASGIVLFELFHRLVAGLPPEGHDQPAGPSPLSVLPLLAQEIAQLAAGGVVVGLVAGFLTRRLLRLLRWYGASTSQDVATVLAGGYLAFYVANSPLHVSGVIAVVVYGLYGNATSHFELGSSRHMRESAAVQATFAFALNGVVFFFAGASAVNFMVRAVEGLADYRRSFALFPPIYLALFAIRGVCILLFNPLFHLLGSQALSLKAVLFATWGGLRGAISLIMVQVIMTDEKFVSQSQLVSAQMGLWTSLFVLCTLLINAPTIPAVLRYTGLTKVSPVKLSIRQKAKRALLRYTAAAIQELKADEDEMLRGVDWGAVERFVDLSEELELFNPPPPAVHAVAPAGAGAELGRADGGLGVGTGVAGAATGLQAEHQRGAMAGSVAQQEELFEAPGWAAPCTPRHTAGSRRAAALADLRHVSGGKMLNSSRRLLGASYTHLSHKWRDPRGAAGSSVYEEAAGHSPEEAAEEEGWDDIDGMGSAFAGSDLEAPLLPAAAGPEQEERLRRDNTASSAAGFDRGGRGGGGGKLGGVSRSSSVDRLTKYGGQEFADEAPFWTGRPSPAGQQERGAYRLAGAKSVPAMHTIVEMPSSSENEESGSHGSSSGGSSSLMPQAAAARPPVPPRHAAAQTQPAVGMLLAGPEDSNSALPHGGGGGEGSTAQQAQHTQHAGRVRLPKQAHSPRHAQQTQHAQHSQHEQRQYASLDFDTGLPSFPSDAAFSLGAPEAQTAPQQPSTAQHAMSVPPAQPTLLTMHSMPPHTNNASNTGGLGAGASQQMVQPTATGAGPAGGEGGPWSPTPPTAAAAPAEPAVAALPPPPPPLQLPRLKLGRLSAPPAALSSPRAAAAASAPGSPRALGTCRAAALSASETAPSAAAPMSPRGMHGLVRTSLLPAAADRQAVLQVGELLGADEAMPPGDQEQRAQHPAWPAPQQSAFSSGSSGSYSPREVPQFGRAGTAGTAGIASTAGQFGGSSGLGPSRLMRHTTSDSGRFGGRSTSGGHGRQRGFGSLMQQQPGAGLAALLKPPSPGKISSHHTSPAHSPEPPTSTTEGGPWEIAELAPPHAAVPPASLAGPLAAPAADVLPGGLLTTLPLPPSPAESSGDLDSSAAGMKPGAAAEALEAAGPGPPPLPAPAGAAPAANLPALLGTAAAAGASGEEWVLPGVGRQAGRLERAASARLHNSLPLGPPGPVEHGWDHHEGAPHHRHFGSSGLMPPAAGAGMAVRASMAAGAAGTAGTAALVKPWRAGAVLLRRSMSSPLAGLAEQLAGVANGGGGDERALCGVAAGGPDGAGAAKGQACGSSQWNEEVVAEARVRLAAGLKRYFHSKRAEGLLSSQGLRILDYACDRAADCAHQPLDVWSVAEREAVGKYMVKLLAWLFFKTKRLTGRLPRALRWPLMPLLRWFSGLIGGVLSSTMLVASEVAVEYWLALAWSPQAQWLRESAQAGPLRAEIAAESERVCKFIVDREIEAPERFQAIQSYRAAMAILRQQAAFIEELYSSGIVNDAERQAMQEPVQRRARQLEVQGPVWRAPSVRQVLRALPFLHHLPEPLFDSLLDRGTLLEYTSGEVIWPGTQAVPPPRPSGLHIVVYGLARSCFTDHRGVSHEYFLGSGGVLGLLGTLTGHPMPGSGPAIAEANALGKGPVVFHIPQGVIRRMRQQAAAGDRDAGQLELDLFRVTGLYVAERLKGQVLASLAAAYQHAAADRARRQAIKRATAASAGAARAAAESGTGEWAAGERATAAAAQAAAAAASVPLSDEEAMAQLDAGRLWRSSQAFARHVLAEIRHQLRDAELLQLKPRQACHQHSHALLMQGSLHGCSSSSSNTPPSSSGGRRAGTLTAPAVLPWLVGHMQAGAGASGEASVLPVSPQAAAAAAAAPPWVAGSGGAILLMCPEEESGTPTSPASDSESEVMGSLFSGAQQVGSGMHRQKSRAWLPAVEPELKAQQQQAQQGEEGQQAQQGAERLEPLGPRLHRVRSRRLPLSSAMLGMEGMEMQHTAAAEGGP